MEIHLRQVAPPVGAELGRVHHLALRAAQVKSSQGDSVKVRNAAPKPKQLTGALAATSI